MARLIDANELAKKIQKVLAEAPNHMGSAAYTVLVLVVYLIESSQTVDAVPVVHGRWITDIEGDEVWGEMCSVCCSYRLTRTNFCPNCGAKMDLKEE